MQWTKEDLDKIRENLPKDWVKTLAIRFNLKPGTVKNTLSGNNNNEELLIAAAELALATRTEKERKREALLKAL